MSSCVQNAAKLLPTRKNKKYLKPFMASTIFFLLLHSPFGTNPSFPTPFVRRGSRGGAPPLPPPGKKIPSQGGRPPCPPPYGRPSTTITPPRTRALREDVAVKPPLPNPLGLVRGEMVFFEKKRPWGLVRARRFFGLFSTLGVSKGYGEKK